jgi:archaellum biogenesis ATPase FlaH
MKPPVRVTEKPTDGSPMFLTAMMIHDMKVPDETFVRTGIEVIDTKMRGLMKGHVSVWSGLRASAKSTLLSEIMLNAVQDGNNVGCFSGELTPKNFMKWMNLQAAGKAYARPSRYNNYFYTDDATDLKIAKWLAERFHLYNNEYGNNFVEVIKGFEKVIDEKKLDLLVLDNLMAFDISDLSDSKWEAQSQFVLSLCSLAKSRNLHIAFVAHPRKSMGFLRFDDIAGTADLGNAVDDAFIVHRNNNDFKRFTKDMFGWKEDNEIYEGTNVVEIVKDRDGGNQDVFIPLYYEVETKRLKNEKSENVIYGWCNDEPPKEPMLSLADLSDYEADTDDNPFE